MYKSLTLVSRKRDAKLKWQEGYKTFFFNFGYILKLQNRVIKFMFGSLNTIIKQ